MSSCSVLLKSEILRRQARLKEVVSEISFHFKSITLEIGCGHGHFLTSYAQEYPDTLCVGLDLLSGRVERANRKRRAAEVDNLYFVSGEAWEFLNVWPGERLIRQVWILFPDPWPKARHAERRLVNASFLSFIDLFTTSDATIYFRTDYTPYFEWVFKCVEAHERWKCSSERFPFEEQTLFEARASSFHSLVVRKRRG